MREQINENPKSVTLKRIRKIRTLNELKTKRLRAMYCWIANIEYNSRIIYGYNKVFSYEKLLDVSETLIPKKYSTQLCLPIHTVLLNILKDKFYDENVLPFLSYINREYLNFNKLNLNKKYSFNDDFWLSNNIKGKDYGWG